MRIIAGALRGRRIATPEGPATRPTADRARGTLFSMLASRLGSFEGLRVADLFAGSGALGLEALSRGAAFACFVENERAALDTIRTNVSTLGLDQRAHILARSALALPAAEPFDLVLADPPYAPGSGSAVLRELVRSGWAGGWVAIETERGERVDPLDLEIDAERNVGRARLTLLRRSSPSPLS